MGDMRQTGDRLPYDRPNRPPIRVRAAAVGDARAIAEIGVLGWQAAYRGILPADFLAGLSIGAREIAWQMGLESDPDGAAPTWIAERAGQVVGYVSSGPPRDEDVAPPTAEVYAIYVLPADWRSGAGRALLTAAALHWHARGAAELVLWVLEDNAAGRRFYEAMGWRPDGARQELALGGAKVIEIRYRMKTAGRTA
jgi:ribosomal protein S18 acetylase RimI-like enzyme